MLHHLQDITATVRRALDIATTAPADDIAAEDAQSVDQAVRDRLPEAARSVLLAAPLRLLEPGHSFAEADITWGSDFSVPQQGAGRIRLPHDFLRLTAFRMSDWHRTVTNPTDPTRPDYALQGSAYPGLRGTPEKPVAALAMRPEGLCLEFWSSDESNAFPLVANYVPVPTIDDHDNIDLPPLLLRPIALTTASIVATTFQDDKRAADLLNLAKALLA